MLRLLNFPNVWIEALATFGVPVHFHDLRHTENQFAAGEASLREPMGHADARAEPREDGDASREFRSELGERGGGDEGS